MTEMALKPKKWSKYPKNLKNDQNTLRIENVYRKCYRFDTTFWELIYETNTIFYF